MIRLIGAGCVALGSAFAGLCAANAIRRQGAQLRQLRWVLEQMKNEIAMNLTPLPELLTLMGGQTDGALGLFFQSAARELGRADGRTIRSIFASAVREAALPNAVRTLLLELAGALGRYDVEGQIRALDLSITRAEELYETFCREKAARCRSWRALGICAGLALAILLL